MKKQNYSELIYKSLTGSSTSEDEQCLHQWLNSDAERKREFEEIKSIWHDAEEGDDTLSDEQFNKGLIKLERNVTASIKRERVLKKLQKGALLFGVLNLFLLTATIYLFCLPFTPIPSPSLTGIRVMNKNVFLPDSSMVSSNEKTVLTASFTDSLREVSLTGEALFDIHKEWRPFQIHIPGFTIHVIGTCFNVRAIEKEDIDIVVLRGNIEITGNNKIWQVSKGQRFSVQASSGIRITENTELNFNTWYTHKLQFDKTELKAVIAAIEKHYNIKCYLKPQIAHCRFTGTFNDISLSDVIQVLSYSMNIEFTLTKQGIYEITGRGCEH